MSLDSLQSLFQDELKDVYHAEKQLLQALQRLFQSPQGNQKSCRPAGAELQGLGYADPGQGL